VEIVDGEEHPIGCTACRSGLGVELNCMDKLSPRTERTYRWTLTGKTDFKNLLTVGLCLTD